jgi:hypothetical protein
VVLLGSCIDPLHLAYAYDSSDFPISYIMNTRPVIEDALSPFALSVAFNTDNSLFSVGLDSGFCSMLYVI